ncbi:MAG: ribose 5-phosphate isomerase B [Candidatus Margulisiibacteriota bacterium]
MKIAIGSDHAGLEMKELLKQYLVDSFKAEIIDVGTKTLESTDYPIYGKKVGELVAKKQVNYGLVICGTGIGISIAANKVKGVRAALCYDAYTAIMARKHNNANVLALGSRTTLLENAQVIVDFFFKTEFEGGRHEKRVQLIES